jgi:hypothetical protein
MSAPRPRAPPDVAADDHEAAGIVHPINTPCRRVGLRCVEGTLAAHACAGWRELGRHAYLVGVHKARVLMENLPNLTHHPRFARRNPPPPATESRRDIEPVNQLKPASPTRRGAGPGCTVVFVRLVDFARCRVIAPPHRGLHCGGTCAAAGHTWTHSFRLTIRRRCGSPNAVPPRRPRWGHPRAAHCR